MRGLNFLLGVGHGGRRVRQDYWAFILCHSHRHRVRNVSLYRTAYDAIHYDIVQSLTINPPGTVGRAGTERDKLDIKGNVGGGLHIACRGRNFLQGF